MTFPFILTHHRGFSMSTTCAKTGFMAKGPRSSHREALLAGRKLLASTPFAPRRWTATMIRPLSLRSWMEAAVNLLEPLVIHVGIDLRGGNACMAQQLLHVAEVSPTCQ